jgi:CRISPR-associated protein Cas1
MTDRVIDISEGPARLRVRDECLVLERGEGEDKTETRVPLKEVAVLVLAEKRVSMTQAVLSGLAEAGGALVTCDSRCMPVGMMLPLNGHSTQGERFARQAAASLPTKKRVWRDVVSAKIAAQGRLLSKLRGSDGGLLMMSAGVRSGDPENVEGQASRRYWTVLFDDPAFRRDRDLPGRNALLNYGYGVLRAIVARAVSASGLHPSLGVHHHNRYDAFCLVDDLMEPFRPVVDEAVVRIVGDRAARGEEADAVELDRETKGELLAALTAKYEAGGEARSLFDLAARAAASLAKALLGGAKKLKLPEL